MADARPFRGLRYDPARADLALTIAPPYDVISPDEQRALYERSPHNVVRIEYGEQHTSDTDGDNRYTRAASDIASWTRDGVLVRERFPAMYAYRQEFTWGDQTHARQHIFAAIRLEPWDRGVIKPHEHTLSGPKADRLDLLRATATQISPVYCLYRRNHGSLRMPPLLSGRALYDVEADGQRHVLTAITDDDAAWAIAAYIEACDVYIADGHHRYETALRYRDERRADAASWSGDEAANFVLMALTDAADPGLLVLPTHRLIHREQPDASYAITRWFNIEDLGEISADAAAMYEARLHGAGETTAFVALGLRPGHAHLLTLRDRAGVDHVLPADQPPAWKRLDVSVLQFAVLRDVFGIDDAALAAGGAVTYTQDTRAAVGAVTSGQAACAFLLNATPVDQVLAVADAGGRMPQKSTYFYPKLPTGLVMHPVGGAD
jgi:uncharacterized protein (DUF1015 family)